jgi:hypothetical protein
MMVVWDMILCSLSDEHFRGTWGLHFQSAVVHGSYHHCNGKGANLLLVCPTDCNLSAVTVMSMVVKTSHLATLMEEHALTEGV